jgi:glycine C-acetyltransferase
LREAAAKYIYSNSISPGTAGAGLAAVQLIDEAEGTNLLIKLRDNIEHFKGLIKDSVYQMAADSIHPIQPLLIGDAARARTLANKWYEKGYLVTTISYPVVPAGRDEIRVQISAAHTKEEIEGLVKVLG